MLKIEIEIKIEIKVEKDENDIYTRTTLEACQAVLLTLTQQPVFRFVLLILTPRLRPPSHSSITLNHRSTLIYAEPRLLVLEPRDGFKQSAIQR